MSAGLVLLLFPSLMPKGRQMRTGNEAEARVPKPEFLFLSHFSTWHNIARVVQ